MKELVEVIAKALVDNPEEVVVTESMKGEDTPGNTLYRVPFPGRRKSAFFLSRNCRRTHDGKML